jgi:ankyrin repeat protein
VVIVHFLIVVAESLKHCSPEETFKLKKLVYELIKLNPKNSKNLTLLHLASSKESSTIIKNHTLNSFPSVDVLQLLLECGANPNILDNEHNTALHLAAGNRSTSTSTSSSSSPSSSSSINERDKIIHLLLNAGTHLDACNINNKTASDLYKGGKLYNIINPVNYLTLQCLAAKVIQKHKIPYNDALTTKLANFVSIH